MENFLEFKPSYKRDDGKESLNLYDLTSKDLTLSFSSETGFKEIVTVRPWVESFRDDFKKDLTDLNSLCDELFGLLHESVEKCWRPEEKHFVMMSGGKDSKIICYILKDCEKKFGRDWLGQCVFVHRETNTPSGKSSDIFWEMMKLFGWENRAYEVGRKDEDHVDFSPALIPNGFWPYYYYWHSCFIKNPAELKDWILVTGVYGGELLAPKVQGKVVTPDRYADLKRVVKTGNNYFSIYHNYKGLLEFYLYKPFLRTVFRVHKSLLGSDSIRKRLLILCGDAVPSHKGYQYNWICSEDRLDLVHKLWATSKFRNDFLGQLGDKKDIKIVNEKMGLWGQSLDSRLFGLAMTYGYKINGP